MTALPLAGTALSLTALSLTALALTALARRGLALAALPLTAVTLAALALTSPTTPALGAVDDVIVPAGAVSTKLSLLIEEQDRAFDQSGRSGSMKNYLIREPSLREEIEGSITRSITRYDLRTTYGISDSWNISLNIPFVEINQNSTISPLSGASASAQELADLLQTRTIQGVGDVELTSLHRPLFSDWNALVWGYGFTIPGESQTEPYVDATSLQLGEPAPMAFGFVHYTRFTALPRSRFDFRPFVRHMFSAPVTVASGETRRLEPVNRLSVKFDWSQELGNFVYGLGAEFMGQGEHTINGERLVDQVRGQIVRTRIGYGNMAGLEDGPQSFSYQLQLEFRSVLRAANIPHGDHMTLSILTFF